MKAYIIDRTINTLSNKETAVTRALLEDVAGTAIETRTPF